jgi:hypothetical protein
MSPPHFKFYSKTLVTWQCIYPINSVVYANLRLSCCQGTGSGWRELSRPDERRDGPELTAGAVPLLTHQYRSAHHAYNFIYSLSEANIVAKHYTVNPFLAKTFTK